MKNSVAFYAKGLTAKPSQDVITATIQELLKVEAIVPSQILRNAWAFGPRLEETLGVTVDSQGWVSFSAPAVAGNIPLGQILHGNDRERSHFIITVNCASMADAPGYRPTPMLTYIAELLGPDVEFGVMTYYM